MLLRDYIDIIISDVFGLVRTDDSKVAELRLEAEMPKWRQEALFLIWNGSRPTGLFPTGLASNHFLHPDNYQAETVTLDPTIQVAGADFLLWDCEPAIALSETANGNQFLGDRLTGQTFYPLKSPGSYWTMKQCELISIDKIYYNHTELMKTWGNLELKSFDRDFLATDPMNVTGFDPEINNYPMGPDVWAIIYKMALAQLKPESLTPADTQNDAAPSIERAKRD